MQPAFICLLWITAKQWSTSLCPPFSNSPKWMSLLKHNCVSWKCHTWSSELLLLWWHAEKGYVLRVRARTGKFWGGEGGKKKKLKMELTGLVLAWDRWRNQSVSSKGEDESAHKKTSSLHFTVWLGLILKWDLQNRLASPIYLNTHLSWKSGSLLAGPKLVWGRQGCTCTTLRKCFLQLWALETWPASP